MLKRTVIQLIYFSLLFAPLNGSWLERKAEGWAWYEEAEQEEETPEVLEPVNSPPAILPLTSAEELAQVKKDLEEKLAAAILNPTEENLTRYMSEQKRWIEKSAQF